MKPIAKMGKPKLCDEDVGGARGYPGFLKSYGIGADLNMIGCHVLYLVCLGNILF